MNDKHSHRCLECNTVWEHRSLVCLEEEEAICPDCEVDVLEEDAARAGLHEPDFNE